LTIESIACVSAARVCGATGPADRGPVVWTEAQPATINGSKSVRVVRIIDAP
jgi:hypothetical protein